MSQFELQAPKEKIAELWEQIFGGNSAQVDDLTRIHESPEAQAGETTDFSHDTNRNMNIEVLDTSVLPANLLSTFIRANFGFGFAV